MDGLDSDKLRNYVAQTWQEKKMSQLTAGQFRVLVDVTELKKVVGLWENKESRERRQGQQ